MQIAHYLLTIALVMFGAGCANDDMPVRANYVPAECPPPPATAEQAAAKQIPVEDVSLPPLAVKEGPTADEARPPEKPGAKAKAPAGTIDINRATEMELTRLPGVGPALAARIVEYRMKRVFEKPEELRRVRGIGPAKFAKMKGMVSVGKTGQKRQL